MNQPGVNVFVTGQPGIGKTALVLKVVSKLNPELVSGFYTVEAFSETGEKLGQDIVTLTGERAALCRLKRGCGPKVGKYYVAIEEFESVVLSHVTPNSKVKLFIIDEVSRLALCSKKFEDAITALLDSPKCSVFGSLPTPRHGHPIPFVDDIKKRPDTSILTLSKANRDATAVHLEDLLVQLLSAEEKTDKAREKRNATSSANSLLVEEKKEDPVPQSSNNYEIPECDAISQNFESSPYLYGSSRVPQL